MKAAPRTVLIVDDSKCLRQMLHATLNSAGIATTEAADGIEALDRLDDLPVDLIITEVNMPKMDGIAFTREVRAREAYRTTPILMIGTGLNREMKEQGRAAGATGWIVKPVHPEKLVQAVRSALACDDCAVAAASR